MRRERDERRTTLMASQIAGEAPLPCPVPKRGDAAVLCVYVVEIPYFVLIVYFIARKTPAWTDIDDGDIPNLWEANIAIGFTILS
jgi:hypothetical protein